MQKTQLDWPATDFSAALDALANAHYAVIRHFLSPDLLQALRNECLTYEATGRFQEAGIGRAEQRQVNSRIRGDRICWLEDDFPAGQLYLQRMEQLRQALNQHFFLGLRSFETHYASYAPGYGYQLHIDRHRDNDARTVSAVCYLNDAWPTNAGGQLRLYSATQDLLLELPPDGGTLVLFMSADMPHEVLAAHQQRYSLAGWFRRDA